MIRGKEQRCIVAYLDGLQAKVNALREPDKGYTYSTYDTHTSTQ